MKLSEFQFHLPQELIAQEPPPERGHSRLMLVNRRTRKVEHHLFSELPSLLDPDDLLVLNDTAVFPARLFAGGSGKPIEVLLIRAESEDVWLALVKPGKKARPGRRLVFVPDAFEAEVLGTASGPIRRLRFSWKGDFWGWIEQIGRMPLPPYIRRDAGEERPTDRTRYQTLFARHRGSIAAPTAGLHFTQASLGSIPHCFITLHVGYGTFQPVRCEQIVHHQMEEEAFTVGPEAAATIQDQVIRGRRVIAVGTTTTRTLEHLARLSGRIEPGSGWTDLFIYPGHPFRVVSGLITNFHLPGSSLLMLVSAFAGLDLVKHCYEIAIEQRYRFYSYGDAMLIL